MVIFSVDHDSRFFMRRRRIASTHLFRDISSYNWLLLCIPFIISVSSIHNPIVSSIVTDYSKHKFGKNHGSSPAAIWVYTGNLIDPVTGTDVCNVEGVELIQSIGHTILNPTNRGFTEGKLLPFSRFRRRCRNLLVFRTLGHKTAGLPSNAIGTGSSDDINSAEQLECHTFLSRKCFCYCSRDKKHLFHSLRRRINGPKVQIPFHQAVSCYDSVVSCIGSPSVPDGTTNDATWFHIERPGGKDTWSRIVHPVQSRSLDEKSPVTSLDFSIFARRRSPPLEISSELYRSEQLSGNNSSDFLDRPSRLRLIQWGSSQQQPSGNDFGARETYQYSSSSLNPNNSVVRYSRHGEAPVWYGPGRMCQLELTGMRIDFIKNAIRPPIWKRLRWNRAADVDDHLASNDPSSHVPIIFNVIQTHIPNFWKFGIFDNSRVVPEWKQSLYNNENTQQNPKNDERDFLYYANALHTELQLDVDGPSPNISDEKEAGPLSLLSGNELRQFYSDLAVRRQIDHFLQQPLKVQQQHIMNPHLNKVYDKLSSVGDKIRVATSVAIGTQRD